MKGALVHARLPACQLESALTCPWPAGSLHPIPSAVDAWWQELRGRVSQASGLPAPPTISLRGWPRPSLAQRCPTLAPTRSSFACCWTRSTRCRTAWWTRWCAHAAHAACAVHAAPCPLCALHPALCACCAGPCSTLQCCAIPCCAVQHRAPGHTPGSAGRRMPAALCPRPKTFSSLSQVDHFVHFRDEERVLPVVWHQCLLCFVQR